MMKSEPREEEEEEEEEEEGVEVGVEVAMAMAMARRPKRGARGREAWKKDTESGSTAAETDDDETEEQ